MSKFLHLPNIHTIIRTDKIVSISIDMETLNIQCVSDKDHNLSDVVLICSFECNGSINNLQTTIQFELDDLVGYDFNQLIFNNIIEL